MGLPDAQADRACEGPPFSFGAPDDIDNCSEILTSRDTLLVPIHTTSPTMIPAGVT